jgi:uncharacterized protein (TIGR00730 family)
MTLRRVCVFCGSSPGADPRYVQMAEQLGELLAARGLGLVYGGASVGLMGALADAALRRGGQVIGVIPRALADKELAHAGLSELRVVGSMHERKALMADLSDAFIALPGGLGTLEEFCEIATWAQLGLHRKPCGLLDVNGYFESLIAFLDRAVAERFIRAEHRAIVLRATDPESLLDAFARHAPPALEKWIDRAQR